MQVQSIGALYARHVPDICFSYFRPKKLDHVGVAVVAASRSTKAAKGHPSDPDPTLYGERGGLIERHGVVNVKKLFLFPFLGGDHRS